MAFYNLEWDKHPAWPGISGQNVSQFKELDRR